MSSNAIFSVPFPTNEPQKQYEPGSKERAEIKEMLEKLSNDPVEIPLIIGGEEVKTGDIEEIRSPHDKSLVLGKYHKAGENEVKKIIETAMEARKTWSEMHWYDRASIFLRAAELLATKYRALINAATMLGQSKTVYQAEIDSACELIDFLRFNVYYMEQIYRDQPWSNPGLWNRVEYRALEGFVFAVTPFNFTAIGGNLPTSPAMMGNVVLLKPSSTAMLSSYYFMKILEEAGLPKGVINMVPGRGSMIGKIVLPNPNLAGIHFTGSTNTFQTMWKVIGENIAKYKSYPRIVGETGGKDFIFAHKSSDVETLKTALVRGAYEYQGQKCSAASRAYIPKSIWSTLKEKLADTIKTIKMGDVKDFSNFMAAVIDKPAFDSIKEYIDYAKNSKDAEILVGGNCDDSKGYFIEPTVITTTDPHFKTMEEEIFGPVLTIYVYDDDKYEETLDLCDNTSAYALTGAIFSNDRAATNIAFTKLRNSAGNFYINDKPTGAVVGQQPFGGARASGTNDKAGSKVNLLRWVSQRTIKETFNPPIDYKYPHMEEE